MKTLLYEQLVLENTQGFKKRVIEIGERLGIHPDWLMAVFYIETNAQKYGYISHRIQNGIGATGLIQFLPSTARGLGVSTEDLRRMSNVEQLEYVYRYLMPYKGRMKSYCDVYLAVFFPLAIGKPDDWVLESKGLSREVIASQNQVFDLNRDKCIQVWEVKDKIQKFIPKGYEV